MRSFTLIFLIFPHPKSFYQKYNSTRKFLKIYCFLVFHRNLYYRFGFNNLNFAFLFKYFFIIIIIIINLLLLETQLSFFIRNFIKNTHSVPLFLIIIKKKIIKLLRFQDYLNENYHLIKSMNTFPLWHLFYALIL